MESQYQLARAAGAWTVFVLLAALLSPSPGRFRDRVPDSADPFQSIDAAGNAATGTTMVTVAHDQGRR